MDALPYQEPPMGTLLPVSSFLLALHVVAWPLDQLIACGLLGQIVIGMIWAPLTSWLSIDFQKTIVQLGYIGLVLLVYEGGLMTDLTLLKETLVSSILVALTGILLPIALSFLLIPLALPTSISPLTAFSAGASLSSTSLGTTYAILAPAKLTTTRIGTVLVTAAMVDDVIGLVMVKVITSIANAIDAETIARPIGVSIAFLLVAVIVSRLFLPILKRISFSNFVSLYKDQISFFLTGVLILGLVAGSGYAGTSILFVGYLTGVCASYLFKESAASCYERYYAPINGGLLLPFFFVWALMIKLIQASIGFAIPIRDIFVGGTFWRGIIYTILMAAGKCATGIWIIVIPIIKRLHRKRYLKAVRRDTFQTEKSVHVPSPNLNSKPSITPSEFFPDPAETSPASDTPEQSLEQNLANEENEDIPPISPQPPSSHLYPALLMALAMTTRGEIGFLIAAIGQSAGILNPEEVYIIVIWGIVLCTLIGPIGVGAIVRKIRKEEKRGRTNILGVWR